MNNFANNNGGHPGGMKRRLEDPRRRYGPGHIAGPNSQPVASPIQSGNQQPILHQPQQPNHTQPHFPIAPGRGRFGPGPPYGGRGPGRGFPPNHHLNHMGQPQQMPGPGPGPGRGFAIQRGHPPPPPPYPRPRMIHGATNPFGPNHNPNHTNMGGPPVPPPPRQPFHGQHHSQPMHQSIVPQIRPPPPPQHQPTFQAPQPQQPHQHHFPSQIRTPHVGMPPSGHTLLPNRGPLSQHAPYPTAVATSVPPQQQMQHVPGVTSTSPQKIPTQYSQTQIDQAWSEYSNNGVKYYFNSILNTSTYHKPMVLENQIQPAVSQPQEAIKTADTCNMEASRVWTEYTDATTGKKYYSNGVTTTWEKPEAFVSPAAIVARSVAEEEAESSAMHEAARKKRKTKISRETPFRNNEEAVAAFKGLLLAKGVSPTQKWNEVVKMCSMDTRWDDCEAVLTTGERKQAMAEYQTKRANDLRDQERQERARAKDAFNLLLSEVLPKLPSFSVCKTRFSDIRDSISKDDRFYAVPNEEMRESLYLDFCEELRKHEERKKRNKKREAQEAFCSFLREKEEAGVLSFSSTWNSFLASISQSDKEDSRFEVSSSMADSDRQLYFADFVIELQAAEDDKRRRIRDARRRAEKAQRDAYRDFLEKLGAEGKISPSSHWRDVERLMEGDAAYEAMIGQDRDAAREIFEEFIDEWEGIYRRERQFLSQLVHPSSNREILVTRDTTYDAFVKALLEEANNSPQTYAEAKRITKSEEPQSSARLYFNELMNKAKEKTTLPYRRRSFASRRTSQEDSSEDEGEIIEEGEAETGKSEEEAGGKSNNTTLAGSQAKNVATKDYSKVQSATGAQGEAIKSKESQVATTKSQDAPTCDEASEEIKPLLSPNTSSENSAATDAEPPATTA